MLLVVVYSYATPLFFELAPFGVFLVEFASIVGKEEKRKNCEEDAPEGAPQTDVIDEGIEANAIVDDLWWKLHVESDGIFFGIIVSDVWDIFEDGLDLQSGRVLCPPPPEIIGQNLVLDNLEIDIHSFVEASHHEKVVKQIVVAIRWALFERDRRLVWLVLYEKEDTTVTGIVSDGIVVHACDVGIGVISAEVEFILDILCHIWRV